MLSGVYPAKKKNGDPYFRAGITYHGKHVSLGSFATEIDANRAYLEADDLYHNTDISLDDFRNDTAGACLLSHDKIITILNHRDNNVYIKTPIYLRSGYFSYFLSDKNGSVTELKFSNDDLFYYSSHRILTRQGHLYVNDYGMQYSILQRFGIKNFAVAGKDYTFANGDETDFRYENIIVINKYHGVTRIGQSGSYLHEAKLHINGEYRIGRFRSDAVAAVAYNKAVDFAASHGVDRQFIRNYVIEFSPEEYASVYADVKLPPKFCEYILSLTLPR